MGVKKIIFFVIDYSQLILLSCRLCVNPHRKRLLVKMDMSKRNSQHTFETFHFEMHLIANYLLHQCGQVDVIVYGVIDATRWLLGRMGKHDWGLGIGSDGRNWANVKFVPNRTVVQMIDCRLTNNFKLLVITQYSHTNTYRAHSTEKQTFMIFYYY